MPHIPGHTLTPAEIQKRTVQKAGQSRIGNVRDPVTDEFVSKEELEIRRRERTAQRGLTRARGIIGEEETALAGRQEEATADFRRRLQAALRGQLGAVGRQTTQAVARRGLTGSGIEQAAQQAVSAAGQQGFAQSLGEFEVKLQEERARFGAASFGFLAGIANMAASADFEADLLRFQAQIAADAASADRWMQLLTSAATIPFVLYKKK